MAAVVGVGATRHSLHLIGRTFDGREGDREILVDRGMIDCLVVWEVEWRERMREVRREVREVRRDESEKVRVRARMKEKRESEGQ